MILSSLSIKLARGMQHKSNLAAHSNKKIKFFQQFHQVSTHNKNRSKKLLDILMKWSLFVATNCLAIAIAFNSIMAAALSFLFLFEGFLSLNCGHSSNVIHMFANWTIMFFKRNSPKRRRICKGITGKILRW